MVAITDFLLAFHPSRSCRGAASTNKRNQEGPIFPSMSFSNLPRAHIDPIEAPLVALRLILMMVDPEASAETLVLTLDHRRCGVSITHVSGTDDPDAVLGVIDALAESARTSLGVAGLVVASIRPNVDFEISDLARWHEADRSCWESDIELVEWFVVGTSISCPREFCGIPARWQR